MCSQRFLPPVLVLGLLSVGCTGEVYREFTVDGSPPSSVSLDARQRVVLVTSKGGRRGEHHVVCAEPSPDSLAAFAAAAAASGALPTGEKLELSGEFAEQVAAMTPRTQTIQLLRDGLYRACEAYMNGIIDFREYKSIVTGYDQFTVTALAVDGLTQHTVSLAPRLDPRASASVGPGTATAGGAAAGAAGAGGQPPPAPSENVANAVKEILKAYYDLQLQLADTNLKIAEANRAAEEASERAEQHRLRRTEMAPSGQPQAPGSSN